ncbi:copper resistance CopC/CopD family protein [Streptomyces sp. HUAS ZL42]|uniref:copper resistance CopC/CopD family protein n=1 Tax=Streptomyces sp. HUAS ZL42 TaxID=3231715 RepID=UPI00345E4E2F
MLLGTLLVLLLLGGAGQASAHAALRDSDPADGTVLKSAPRALTLTFTESVGLLDDSFRILDPDNRRVKTGEAQHPSGRSDTARVTLPAKLGTGTYVVAWRVVSADSHPVSGAFTFSVGKPSPTPAAVPTGPAEDPLTGSLHDIARYVAYLAAALLVGTAVFALACRPPDPGPLKKPLVAGWWALLASTVVLLLLRAPYETGTGPATALDPSALSRTLTGRPGLALLARLLLLLLTALFLVRLRRRERPSRPALVTGAALAVGLALTWAAAEHASAGIQVPLAMTASVLHLLAMAVWLGGLAALLTTLHRGTLPAPVITRYSRLAFASVTVLVVTGVYQSWRGLGSLVALTGTSYGRLLLAKLAAVTLLLAVAACSRRWTARAATAETESVVREKVPETVGAARGSASEGLPAPASQEAPEKPGSPGADPGTASDAHRRALRRSVLVEVAVSFVVLLITTVLSSTLPGRAEAEAQAAAPAAGLPATSVTTVPFDVGTPSGRGKVQVTLDSGRVGDSTVEAVVFGPDDGITTVPELRISFTLPSQKLGPIDAEVTDRGGYWAGDDLTLPIAGTWEMKVTVRTSDVDQVSVTRPVRITR